MSTNIHIFAEREVEVVKTGARQIQQLPCKLIWQTPTEVTRNIMLAEDKKQAYIDWVLSISKDEIVSTYAEEDVFCDNPVGTEVYNAGKEHVREFIAWCNYGEKEGYEIKFVAW